MKLFDALEKQLKKEPNFVTDDGELKKWVVLNKAQSFDEELICLLLENAVLKEKFFVKVKDALVFNQNLFSQFLEQKNYLNDSYTQYKKIVGLTIDGKYLKQRNEVALVWPFKDCILEGGQSQEEQNREEIFFNEVLAQDEKTQLLEPKVLTNAKRIDKDGEKPLSSFNRDAEINKKRGLPEDTITDNLIIKGNNLLALHSLAEEFAGKVKLIYIDPPYNTGDDSFRYNDRFNKSTWLTFMKNRLMVAKDLLKKSGSIFIQIDHHMLAYLSILMDEIFGEENKVQIISVKTASPAGFKTVNPGPIDVTEYILFYTKDKSSFNFKKSYVRVDYDENYKYVIRNPGDSPTKWKLAHIRDYIYELNGIEIGKTWQQSNKNAKKKWGEYWKVIRDQMISAFALENPEIVVSIRDPHKPTKELKKLLNQSKKFKDEVLVYDKTSLDQNEEGNGNRGFVINGGALSFFSNKVREIDGKIAPTELLTDFWKDLSWDGIAKEGGVKLKNGKKPERLIKRIVELSTDSENEIVMDFHLGSGTTAAVAHKLGFQYIGIEQLDYGGNDSVVRLKNCIDKDQSGISKIVDWKGGGSFVYLELKKYNQTFIDQIEAAKDTQTILDIWEQMKAKSFLNYNVDIQEQEKHLEEFKADSLKNQKQLLLKLLDLNQLYVNFSSLDDKDFACTVEEKATTKDFYQIKG
jgi:adenine-specific DNA-methyltransferase